MFLTQQPFYSMHSPLTNIIRGSERFVRCIQRVGEGGIKFDCELMPSAPSGTVFSPVSSPGFQTYLSVYIIYLRYYFSFKNVGNNLECPKHIKERFDGIFSESSNCDEIFR